ncbi:glycoside hydrolase 43 family protein [Muribaculum sp.]|uniref:glycoside hydrolase family 43 protein n=1 Tax=Muribaculum sp. TaxID=1918611 RepID=UPI0023C5AD34|nr:glycoside hydrolase 43 family protein [Muribaculum sp.]MDE5705546.1 glycoside hydrolase 43 family protein [Muribaculum sp.]
MSLSMQAAPELSEVWVADLGNGKYQNPIIYADYSDPDVVRVGDDFYMTASSFNCVPGLPILHSKDLVNWTIISYAIDRFPDEALFVKDGVNHGNAVWAPSIRYHNGEFYIYYGDPDLGIFMTKAKDPKGPWSPLKLVARKKGVIDTCPLWDEDGKAYMSWGFAGSRANLKSVLAVCEMAPDGESLIGQPKIVYDGHDVDVTIEGTKFYKRNGYYYIMSPAGGVPTGWETILRSKSPWGPYERKVVLAQGDTDINGPHQGGWVDTPDGGEDWFIHFQDVGAVGRIVHLNPVHWIEDWPVMGVDKDGDGCGDPVRTYKKPNVGKTYPKATPQESDEFNDINLGLQWQWHGNPEPWWGYNNVEKGVLSLYSVPVSPNYKSLWDVPNLLLQKIPAPSFTATMKVTLTPDKRYDGERTGLVVMGLDYAVLALEKTAEGFRLSENECHKADKGKTEVENASVMLPDSTAYLRVKMADGICNFSYSLDGKKFKSIGKPFTAREGKWIGAKIGTFCTRPKVANDGGRADIDWFRVTKL